MIRLHLQRRPSLGARLFGMLAALVFAFGARTARADLASPGKALRITARQGDTGARFTIDDDGVYAIEARTLAELGLALPVASDWIQLRGPEGEIPLLIEDGGDDVFDADAKERIVFHGTYARGGMNTTRRIYNDDTPYWLSLAAPSAGFEPPRRIEIVSAEAARAAHPDPVRYDAFYNRVRFEQMLNHVRWLGADPNVTDFYFGPSLNTSSDSVQRIDKIFPSALSSPSLDDRRYRKFEVQLRLKLWGISRPANVPGHSHELELAMNGEELGRLGWDGVGSHDWETTCPQKLLLPHVSQVVELRCPEDRREIVDQMYVDWVELGYARSLWAGRGPELAVSAERMEDEGRGVYLVTTGWVNKGARLLDPASGKLYEPVGSREQSKDGTVDYRYEFVAARPASGPQPPEGVDPDPYNCSPYWLAYTPESIKPLAAEEFEKWTPVDPADAIAAAGILPESVILTHPLLWEEAGRLADFRESRGLTTALVDIQSLYECYTSGYHSRDAVVKFVRELLAADSGSAWRYMTLFGASSLDYKGMFAARNSSYQVQPEHLLPIYYFEAGYYNRPEVPADQFFVASADDSEFPLLAVGRISAGNVKDARAYVDKVIEYETAPADAPWRSRSILISSWERSFKNLLDEIANSTLPEMRHQFLVADLDHYENDVQRIEDAIDEGCAILYYVGHGGAFVWRVGPVDFAKQKDLFSVSNIDHLTNAGKYPVVFASSCYTTSFDSERSIGENFIFAPERGAIAVVGSPWKTSVTPNHQFNKRMMELLYPRSGEATSVRLGDAFLQTKREKVIRGDAQICFTLLGDPCLEVRMPAVSPAPEDPPATEPPPAAD